MVKTRVTPKWVAQVNRTKQLKPAVLGGFFDLTGGNFIGGPFGGPFGGHRLDEDSCPPTTFEAAPH